MRIAFVTETYPPEINGVALTVERAVAYLRSRGHGVELVRPCQPGETRGARPDEWLTGGYPIPMYPDMRFGVALPQALVRHFEATRVETVHVATQGPLGWAAVHAACRLGLAVTSDFRTNFHSYSHFYRLGWLAPTIERYLRRFHNKTDLSFAPTTQTRDALQTLGFERVEVLGRGVDLDRFSPAHRDPGLRASWVREPGLVALYVGRLAAEKNVALALRAFDAARRLVPFSRMVVVGEGPLRAELSRAYPWAHFAGVLTGDALAAHYASADVFLFPSQSETFGNVTLEALASGLPVVAFDLAAASEWVTDRVNGRLARPNDEEGFMLATCLQVTNCGRLDAMRVSARARACEADWGSVLRRFEHHLAEVVEVRRRSGAAAVSAA